MTISNILKIDPGFFESVILFGRSNYGTLIKSWIGGSFTTKLCWRAARHGWSASTFHSNCNYKKPTVTIVKVGSYIFGGYATASWEGEINNNLSHSSIAFLHPFFYLCMYAVRHASMSLAM